MARRVLILGGGTGGTLAANRLRRVLGPDQAEITVVDADNRHVYQPGLLFVPFGLATPARLVRSRSDQLLRGIAFRRTMVDRVDLEAEKVVFEDGSELPYDVLVVATGASLVMEDTEGLGGPGWGTNVHTFYSLQGAAALGQALARFEGGRLVVNMVDMPIKCPVAPLEFCFLADWYLHNRGIRDRVEITYVTSLDGAFTKASCNRELSGLLAAKGVQVVTEFNTAQVDAGSGKLVSYDGREVGFDLAVVVPLHGGAPYVGRSPGLGDELGFIPTDEGSLQAKAATNVFAIGDATDLRASKAGSVAHFEGETLVHNIVRFLGGSPLDASFDGHTNCFIESGFGKALLIDYNYDLDPVPGRFPGRLGLPLLKESRLNHFGKLAFESIYWHVLLPGRDLPLLKSAMPLAGKRLEPAMAA
jgi:sulfide:quinone oxidoreductase